MGLEAEIRVQRLNGLIATKTRSIPGDPQSLKWVLARCRQIEERANQALRGKRLEIIGGGESGFSEADSDAPNTSRLREAPWIDAQQGRVLRSDQPLSLGLRTARASRAPASCCSTLRALQTYAPRPERYFRLDAVRRTGRQRE